MDASSAALIEGLREAAKAKVEDLSGQFDPSPRRLVGSGGYSTVYVAAWKPPQRENLVKVCYKELRPPVSNLHETVDMIKKTVKYLTREMEIWGELDHPHILKFLGFAIEGVGCDVKGVLVSPWCSNGSVLEYLQKNPNAEKIDLVSGIAKGLDYLHHRTPAVIHGDLKPANVLVSDDHKAILCDFGLSRFSSELSTGQTSSATNFTIRFAPLEILDEKKKSTESDVYSFACTCVPILFGKQPYSDLSDMQILRSPPQLQKKSPWNWDFEDPLQRTLSDCCSAVSENRPSIRKVLQTISSVGSKSSPSPGDTGNVPKSVITGFLYPSPHNASMLDTSEPSSESSNFRLMYLSAEEPNGGEDIVPGPVIKLRKPWWRRWGTKDSQGPVQPADQASSSSSSVSPTSFPNLGGKDSPVRRPRRTSIEAARVYHRPLPPVTAFVDQEIDVLRSEIKKRREESDRLTVKIEDLRMANADLRVNLQHHESLEPSQLLEEFRTLNRSIEHLCRDISERHIERLGIIFKDLTTKLVRNPHEFCRLLPGVEKGPSLYWSAERKFRPLKDAADYAFRDIINRELVGRIFDPFHPSLREFTATDREFKRTYESMRKASTQISCGRWRALCFQYIDVQSRNRAVDTDNVALDIDTVALDMERVLLGPLLSSLQNRNPTPISLSQFQISALKTILAAAYEWNRKVKSQLTSIDYHVNLPRDTQFDERSMQYLGNKKVVDSSRQIISVASLGLESSDAGKAGAQPNRVWPEKIRVITEDCFEQT